ncbi:MAG: adenine deaminase [Erysipelotrichaceae bacterium]
MRIEPQDKQRLLKVAYGAEKSDLLIKNAQLVNVITGEIYPVNVFVCGNTIAHVEYKDLTINLDQAKQVIDAKGKYLIPGLIDAHIHIESSMMTPRNFAKAVLVSGTTTVVTDPHEIGNVYGVEGVKYMHDNADGLPMRQYIDIPSCVPSVPGKENAGADFLAAQIEELASLPRVIGLAEVMDYLAVIHGEQRMMDILQVARDKGIYIQGHAPFLFDRDLSAYICGGPTTCHESRSAQEGIEKLRNGMFVDSRDSSITKNVADIWEGVKHCRYFDHLCFCTDDREADEILHLGHMNDVVRNAIKHGMNEIDAIKSATLNTAREIKAENLGAIAPGYIADMLLVDDLKQLKPSHVFFEGNLVAQDGVLLTKIEDKTYEIETRNSVHIKELSVEDFKIKAPIQNGTIKVNLMKYENLLFSSTDAVCEEIPVKDGYLDISGDSDLKFVAVVNRYVGNNNIALGLVRGFGTNCGALVSTVSHDSHNLTVVYDTAENALIAANEIKRVGGGMCAVKDHEILHTLELGLAGLISLKPAETLAIDNSQMKKAINALGLIELENPLLRIVTLALPVVPNAKMSDLGLIDVSTKNIIPLFA